jgi:hypothetical protein
MIVFRAGGPGELLLMHPARKAETNMAKVNRSISVSKGNATHPPGGPDSTQVDNDNALRETGVPLAAPFGPDRLLKLRSALPSTVPEANCRIRSGFCSLDSDIPGHRTNEGPHSHEVGIGSNQPRRRPGAPVVDQRDDRFVSGQSIAGGSDDPENARLAARHRRHVAACRFTSYRFWLVRAMIRWGPICSVVAQVLIQRRLISGGL